MKHFRRPEHSNIRITNKRGRTLQIVEEDSNKRLRWVDKDRKTIEEGAPNKLTVSMRLAMNGDKRQHLYPHPRIRALREDVTFLHRVNASPYVSPGFSMEGGNLALLANIHKDPVVDTTIGMQSRPASVTLKHRVISKKSRFV